MYLKYLVGKKVIRTKPFMDKTLSMILHFV